MKSSRSRAGPEDGSLHLATLLPSLITRIEALETRLAPSIGDVDPNAASVLSRLDRLADDQASAIAHVSHALSCDADAADRRAEAVAELGAAVEEVAGRLRTSDARSEMRALRFRESIWGLRRRLDDLESRHARPKPEIEADLTELTRRVEQMTAAPSPAAFDADVLRMLGSVEQRQSETLQVLDQLGEMLGRFGADTRAGQVAPERVEHVREEPAALDSVSSEEMEQIEASLQHLSETVKSAQHRSSGAIQQMGEEVIRLATALDGRMREVEQRSDARAEEMGGDMARLTRALSERLAWVDDAQAQALERLRREIVGVAERLSREVAAGERANAARVAEGVRKAGEQLHLTTEQLDVRCSRATEDLEQRLRRSEQATTAIVASACDRMKSSPAPVVSVTATDEAGPLRAAPHAAVSAFDPMRTSASSPASTGGLQTIGGQTAATSPSTRELIENARTAARLQAAQDGRHPSKPSPSHSSGHPMSPRTGDGVLVLRNGFGLLKRRSEART